MPKISVIVPVYKVEDYLDRCVESILAQTFTDFELILVDDGSPDNCPTMCDSWAGKDSRIRVIHKENGGLSDARNVGFAASCGEWITFIDSDDYVHPEILQALFDAVQKFDVKVSACGFTRTMGEPIAQKQDLTANLWNAEDLYMQRNVNATVAWGKLYHRSVVLPYPVGKLHEDEFVTYRILFACEQIAVLDAALYGYYQNPASIMGSKWNPKRMDAIQAYEQRLRFFAERGDANLYRFQVMSFYLSLTTQLDEINSTDGYQKERKRMEAIAKRLLQRCRREKIFCGEKHLWMYARFYPRVVKLWCFVLALLQKAGLREKAN